MTTFDDRENAYENKFARDNETEFKITMRRNKLVGYWAADQMGLKESDRDAYAKAVVESDFEVPGDDDVVAKVHGDLEKSGLSLTERDVREAMHRLKEEARQQILNG